MQFSEQWLREWINPKLSIQDLSLKFTMAGLEVDSIQPVAPKFSGVYVGRIETIIPHPGVKHLKICQVQLQDHSIKVICGAANVEKGQKVAVAVVGAHLPLLHAPKQTLESVEFDGESSEGMILSAAELGLAEKSEGILILHQTAPIGQAVWEYLHLEDNLIEIDLTPNRGDCLSIQGLARELHTLTKATLHPVRIENIPPHKDDTLAVHIEEETACPRYCGRIIKNIDCAKPTPDWMKEKLRRSDIRSINPIVDILNYVMLEFGQPMHAFDLDKIEKAIYVRWSQAEEKLILLDGKEVTLHPKTLIIADVNKPLAIAGIMGGEESAVTEFSKNIFLESAFFHPEAIVGKARSFGLHTDSSARFERGVDPKLQDIAIERATQWILDICGGEPCPITDIKTNALNTEKSIELSITKVKKLIGMDLQDKSIVQDLERLGCEVALKSEDIWDVKVPSFRFDLSIPEDLVEEIARCAGYASIVATLPKAQLSPNYEKKPFSEKRVKHALVDFGYHEAITYSFVDPKLQDVLFPDEVKIALSNPIASDLAQMRISLWPGLLKALQYNYHRQQNNIFLFETGLVFQETAAGLVQEPKLGGVCLGSLLPEHWSQKPKALDFYDIKGHLETLWCLNRKDLAKLKWEATNHPALHPGQACQLLYKDKVVGVLGALHPDVEKYLDIKGPIFVFELKLKALLRSKSLKFRKPSVFPSIRRDLSMVIDASIPYEKLSNWIHNEAGNLLKKLVLFDIYQGKNIKPGCKSVAIGFIWQDPNRTLVDKEIDEIMQDLMQGLEQQFGAQLRE